MNCKLWNSIYIAVITIIALLVGLFTVLYVQYPVNITGVKKFLAMAELFFRPMIPILGVGALFKFIWCYGSHCDNR